MPDWATFAVAAVALTLLLLFFTRRSRRLLESARFVDSRSEIADENDDADRNITSSDVDRDRDDDDADLSPNPDRRKQPVLTTRLLLANATVSQAIALIVLVAIAWWTAVPASAFGIGGTHPTLGAPAVGSLGTAGLVALGAGAGLALAAGNEAVARLGARAGVAPSTRLREAMAPTDASEWALLLGVALPVVAIFEETLFRGALIGALSVGFGVDPRLLVVASSVAFGLGHGAQGRLGIAVAGGLGIALAGLFVATGSLLAVVVAHYVVNAVEFVAHERSGASRTGPEDG
ncbi:CPBP family intramembrane glutamic endopeptidase [Halorubrum halophilum]|uniref:CPBP family intramembrane glutamic endopeptidase n=1 Tax=Halorubrum halophilum TaxID=413816 RepID=UPI00067927C8|nr:CPBP family intramembrane glutamic endopeptidase [Halorubrum halophilum]